MKHTVFFDKRAAGEPALVCLAILVLDPGASAAVAQEDQTLEEIVVTGSRIARDPNLTGSLPVQTIDAADIQLSGEFELSDIVNDLPALLSSVTSEQSIDSTLRNGSNVLELRGLGTVRTLVLVDGRRHVGGVQGTSSVDVGSIPIKLVERVEVLTGGASAIYGADAVTGVINFILKDDYEGFGIDAYYGVSSEGDAQQTAVSATWGRNFLNDRANFAVSVDYRVDDGLKVSERPGEFYGTANSWPNPELRFQIDDINANATPNFSRFFNFANTGLFRYGLPIPGAADFTNAYNATFGTDPVLTSAELALINRAANAYPLKILPEWTFPITSGYGVIVPGNPFTFAGFDPLTPVDLNSNESPDCLDSFVGYNSVFGAASYGAIGGCWNIAEDGTYAPVRDVLVSSFFQGFGGDSVNAFYNDRQDILLPDDRLSVNFFGQFDFSESASVHGEFKYVTQQTDTGGGPNSFWDLLFGASDNPFLPEFIRSVAQQTGGVAITVDPLHFDQQVITERDTFRGVLGIEGAFDNGWNYDFSVNYGRYDEFVTETNSPIVDRMFAALDTVVDPVTGQPACRADVDPNASPLTTPFQVPPYDAGFFSFTPGTGQCVPLNIWAGRPGVTQAAKNWALVDEWDKLVIDQLVISAYMTGDSADFMQLPAGAISFAVGAEYRDESSNASFDQWKRGVIPGGAPFPAGSNIEDWSANSSLTFRPKFQWENESGSFDVADIFLESSFPLLADLPGARELTLEAAVRFSDYSTIGQTTTWKTNLIYAPLDDLVFRGSYSEAVRAPNINELFNPQTSQLFGILDPCDAFQIAAIAANDPVLARQTQDNCVEDFATIGLDPFDAQGNYVAAVQAMELIDGVNSGNRLLSEESAETITAGLVFEPQIIQGFSLTFDYWNISIESAIQQVGAGTIVNSCYQRGTFEQNQFFCQLFTRNPDPNSIRFGVINFLRATWVNYAKLESSGYDVSAKYRFDVGAHEFDLTIQGSKVNEINFFTNPLNLSQIDFALGEKTRPEIAGNVFVNWVYGNWKVGWQSQYMDQQLLGGADIETAETLYGVSVFMDEFWRHDVNARYMIDDQLMIYGGIKNISKKKPFITDNAYPASPRGMFFFIGVDYQM